MLEKIITFNASLKLHAAIEGRAKALGIKKSRLLREAVIHGLLPAEKAIREEEERADAVLVRIEKSAGAPTASASALGMDAQ